MQIHSLFKKDETAVEWSMFELPVKARMGSREKNVCITIETRNKLRNIQNDLKIAIAFYYTALLKLRAKNLQRFSLLYFLL
jgi:hypothetical protein